MTLDLFFDRLWQQYVAVTPSADSIRQLLGEGAHIVNDHIAVRTFNLAGTGLEAFARHLLAMGYRKGGSYHFANKHLDAAHYEHDDPSVPKVFISELQVESLSTASQAIIQRLAAQVSLALYQRPEVFFSGRPWQLTYADYQTLLKESEYAAWLAAYGYRANHFTISVNQLAGFDSLQQVNRCLLDAGYRLNTVGGEIKGSAEVLLEQSSTMADEAEVVFDDGKQSIPSCFYEFAQRYPKPDGELYSGFVEASADKIFSSTDRTS